MQAYIYYRQQAFACKGDDKGKLVKLAKGIQEKYHINIPKTAVVILSYNTQKETQECIESIRQNCAPGTYELIVVENASSDGSAAWLKQQADIKLHCNTANLGFPAGCNQGIGSFGTRTAIARFTSFLCSTLNFQWNRRQNMEPAAPYSFINALSAAGTPVSSDTYRSTLICRPYFSQSSVIFAIMGDAW